MTAGRRRIRDLVAAALFIGLLAVLFWPGGSDDPELDAAPDGVAELEEVTPEATETPIPRRELSCDDEYGPVRLLNSFVAAVNTGDRDALSELFPSRGAGTPITRSYSGMNQSQLHSFRVHESGYMSDPAVVIDYVGERVNVFNERWRMDDLEVQRMGRGINASGDELDRLIVGIHRYTDDSHSHDVYGEIVINCYQQQVLMVELESNDAELALPIPVDEFLSAVGPYGTGEMRDLRMIVSTDLREDTGWPLSWDIRRIEANSMSGSYVEHVTVDTINGNRIIDYLYDGSSWYLEKRDWREVGDVTGWGVLPLEIMLTRREPSITADILREHLDDIPAEGGAVFTGTFDIRDELRDAAARVPLAEAVEGVVEVRTLDGNLVSTSYRLMDRQLGLHSHVPNIEWIHIRRLDRYDPTRFVRPAGFEPGELQYDIAPSFDGDLEFIERLDHQDGVGERFALTWNGGLVDVVIRPSRGLSHELTGGDDWPLTWDIERMQVNGYPVSLAGADYAAFPEAAVWDTRRFRYEIRVDPDGDELPDDWDMDAVMDIATALLSAEPRDDGGWRWIGP